MTRQRYPPHESRNSNLRRWLALPDRLKQSLLRPTASGPYCVEELPMRGRSLPPQRRLPRRRDGLTRDDLTVVAEVGEDLRRTVTSSEAPWNQQIFFSIRAWRTPTARGDGSRFSQA